VAEELGDATICKNIEQPEERWKCEVLVSNAENPCKNVKQPQKDLCLVEYAYQKLLSNS